MSNSEFFIVGLVFLVLSNVTGNQIFSVLYAVLAVIYMTVSLFRKEYKRRR